MTACLAKCCELFDNLTVTTNSLQPNNAKQSNAILKFQKTDSQVKILKGTITII